MKRQKRTPEPDLGQTGDDKMKVTINEKMGEVTIQAKIGEDGGPYVSKSGQSVLLVSTAGTKATDATYKGHQVTANINVMIPNPDAPEKEGKAKGPKVKASIG